ncbi:MAG: DPP IV N-terminal domain-containing protein [Prevotellaceae bacterium]|nr:DPP IV N-terminal domain-containing protein [Prevotellaceae bacterium]
MNNLKTLATAIVATISMTTAAQELKQFTLEDLNFGGTNYRNMVPKNMYLTWWGDKLMYQDAEESGNIDMTNGQRHTLFNIEEVNGKMADGKIVSAMNAQYPYADKTLVLLGNSKMRLLYDWNSKEIVWKQDKRNESSADWNSSSKAVAFVDNESQLCITDASNITTRLTTDGSREIVYGQSVHRDEFGIYKGTFWSPDGMRLAFYRMDQSMVADYPQVNTFEREATYEPDKYPMAGMTSHKVTVGVYDLNTKKTIYLQAGDPTDRYFTNIQWSPDGSTIYMFELNRDQNDCSLVSYDATTGAKKGELYRETHEKYVEPLHPIVFLPWDNSKFIMQSQKDGYNHLYVFDLKTNALRQLTTGTYVIENLVGFNKKQKSIIVEANAESPIQRNIYTVDLKSGKMKRIDNGRGVHNASLSASGLFIYDRYSEPDVPRNIDLVNTANGKSLRLLTADDPWKGYNQPEFSCGTVKAADGTTDLYYRMVKPIGFDPTKKYPTVIYVYGGPHAHNVEASWHFYSRSWETYMAQKGYLLFILDNRGSERRGRDFEQATFRQLGQVEMADQMKGVEYLKSLPYVDQHRMGVHGWSFGGYMTTTLMTNHPEVFKVGVAGGPVIDWKWYEVMYGERYMDSPEANPEGYAKTSLLKQAKNLKGKLQIIIGMNDPTVVPQHALQFLDACIKAGTQPDFFVYPGEGHNMRGHASVHLHERITQYFEDYLK